MYGLLGKEHIMIDTKIKVRIISSNKCNHTLGHIPKKGISGVPGGGVQTPACLNFF